MRVDNSIDYTINENSSSVNITVLLDQPSCRMITITATPQIRSPPSARGNIYICVLNVASQCIIL